MSFSEFLGSAIEAWALLAGHPFRWLAVVVVFLILVESLMLIPYVGFVVKLSVAAIVVPAVVALFAQAAHGVPPSPVGMLGALSLPASTKAVLVASTLLPFAVGIIFLYVKGGSQAIEFFFGNVFSSKPPPAALFEQFKYVMQIMGIPFSLLAGAVAVSGLAGMAALSAAILAAIKNWLPVLLLAILALAFEWSAAHLPAVLPKPLAAGLSVVLLVVFVAWSFAVMYTVSEKVFNSPGANSAA